MKNNFESILKDLRKLEKEIPAFVNDYVKSGHYSNIDHDELLLDVIRRHLKEINKSLETSFWIAKRNANNQSEVA